MASHQAPKTAQDDRLTSDDDLGNLVFLADLKARYHAARADFLIRLERYSLMMAGILSAFGALGIFPQFFAILTLSITLLLAYSMPAKAAEKHAQAKANYRKLLFRLETMYFADALPLRADYESARSLYYELGQDAEQMYRAVEAFSYNDVIAVRNIPHAPIDIPIIERLLKHIFVFPDLPAKSRGEHPHNGVAEQRIAT